MTKQIKILRQESPRADSCLGHIVKEFYVFLNEGACNPRHQVYLNRESYKSTDASQFFYQIRRGGRDANDFLVRQERLPLDPNIRSIASKHGRVLIETSKIDFSKLESIVKEEGIKTEIAEVKGRTIWYGGEKIIETRTQNAYPKKAPGEKDMRTLITMLPGYQEKGWDKAMKVVDLIDNRSCFIEPDETTFYGKSIGELKLLQQQVLTQEQRMQMLQALQQIQVPILALQMRLSPYLIARMSYLQRILKMNTAEVEDYVKKNPLVDMGILEMDK